MTPEQFRQCGHQAIDWVADYLANPQRYPVLARVQPGELTDALPAHGPEQGDPPECLLADFERLKMCIRDRSSYFLAVYQRSEAVTPASNANLR